MLSSIKEGPSDEHSRLSDFPAMCLVFRASRRNFPTGSTSGTWLVAAIVAVAVLAAGITIAYHWSQSRYTVEYWGGENATRIRAAKKVVVVDWNGDGQPKDISTAKGLVHFRQALIEDASFVKVLPYSEAIPLWQVDVIFTDPATQTETVVQFDLNKGLVGMPDRVEVLDAQPIAKGLRTFFADLGIQPER